MLLALAILAVVVILVFDYTNGFHDASNVMATAIASRAMTPLQAVLVAGFFHFAGPLIAGTAVADTIGSFVDVTTLEARAGITIVLCGIAGAVVWNLITWWLGIPSSSSHALVGGLVGAVVISAGPGHVVWGLGAILHGRLTGVTKVVGSLVLSPILGFWAGFAIHRGMVFLLRAARPTANVHLRRLQWLTTAALAFSHGANDAQKSMGVMTMILLLAGLVPEFRVPVWVILACAAAMTLGTLSGGWRIVRTLGYGIYKVRPLHAFDAQLTSGAVIFAASLAGAPVSTTHVVSSSIMGIGASERPKAVRWEKAKEIVGAWVVTIPCAALVAMGVLRLARLLGAPV
jgi:PiT family inorganic phosphate transporter